MLDKLSFIFPYWESPCMLEEQVRHWRKWPDHLSARTTFLIVDDCSHEEPINVAFLREQPFDIRVWRIGKKKNWNWRAAKNIAMHHAPEGWCLITDIDHVLAPEHVATLFATKMDESCVYHFRRRNASDGRPHKPHGSTHLMTRAMFWRTGGHDESYAGCQSGGEGEFHDGLRAAARKVVHLPIDLIRYQESVIWDSTAKLPRGTTEDRAEFKRLKEMWRERKVLTFPYERLL